MYHQSLKSCYTAAALSNDRKGHPAEIKGKLTFMDDETTT